MPLSGETMKEHTLPSMRTQEGREDVLAACEGAALDGWTRISASRPCFV